MQLYYFPTPEAKLFAAYHEPQSASRRSAVLLCYPVCQEYLSAHRTCRQLAALLSTAGFPTLRFDYFGCGDSGGSADQASLERWLQNISAAAEQIRAKSNVSRLCLVGLRLGASLAMLAAARNKAIDSLVLWDPIVRGSDYLAELAAFHEKVLDTADGYSRGVVRPPSYDGLSLYGFRPHLQQELATIDLLAIEKEPARQVLLLESTAGRDREALANHLKQRVPGFQYQHIPAQEDLWTMDFELAIPPRQILNAIVRWISEVSQ
jgi:alpha/beta superfamily hydrolase